MGGIITLLIVSYPILSFGEVCEYNKNGTFPGKNATDINTPDLETYEEALVDLDIKKVFEDLYELMTTSDDCWPADTLGGKTHYGGFFIRLAWHCAGTFRDTDGVGGCSGGRQRFDPEASWDDNTNLDKARAILYPIKEEYGDALSWGDLIVFAGTAAIIDMGGPATEVCAGRIDDEDGENSYPLGFNGEPESAIPPCNDPNNQNCPIMDNDDIGASTVGLIYVNPTGVAGNPVPSLSAERIRLIFGRMGMNDTETVALIGGGHAFGKSHGACDNDDAAGEPPSDNPEAPWVGTCDVYEDDPIGKGRNTFTSGIEGQWTSKPFEWDNEYFVQLVEDEYNLETGPGGAYQWKNNRTGYLMMTTDLALLEDDSYREIVELFAESQDALDIAFGNVWEKLMSQGGVWANNTKCVDASELIIDDGDDDSGGLSDAEITVISVIGGIVVLIIIGVMLYYFCKKRNKSERLRSYENMDNIKETDAVKSKTKEKSQYGATTELGATDEQQ